MGIFKKILSYFTAPLENETLKPGQWVFEKTKKYLSEEEIVRDMISRMDEKCIASWKELKKDDLIEGHFTTGRDIRNFYLLWDLNNPYTMNGRDPDEEGICSHPEHPDAVSMRIMERVHEILNA